MRQRFGVTRFMVFVRIVLFVRPVLFSSRYDAFRTVVFVRVV